MTYMRFNKKKYTRIFRNKLSSIYKIIIYLLYELVGFNVKSKTLPKLMSRHNIGSYVEIDSFPSHVLITRYFSL